jgi:hypothetical protein
MPANAPFASVIARPSGSRMRPERALRNGVSATRPLSGRLDSCRNRNRSRRDCPTQLDGEGIGQTDVDRMFN